MEIDAAKLIDTLRSGEPQIFAVLHDGLEVPIAIVPGPQGSAKIEGIKPHIDAYRSKPERSHGTAIALTIDSFIDLFNRHKDDDSAIFANVVTPDEDPTILAVFDYSKNSATPRFGKHRLRHDFPLSEEWKAWHARNLKGMDQEDFANFLDDRIADVADASTHPDANTVKELLNGSYATAANLYSLSRGLSVSASIGVKNAISLEDGRISVQFEEGEHKDDKGKPIKVPNLFVLNIPIFVGGPAVPIIGRLRYKLKGPSIVWHYDLWQIRTVMRGALLEVLEKVRKETGAPVYEGSPEA